MSVILINGLISTSELVLEMLKDKKMTPEEYIDTMRKLLSEYESVSSLTNGTFVEE